MQKDLRSQYKEKTFSYEKGIATTRGKILEYNESKKNEKKKLEINFKKIES